MVYAFILWSSGLGLLVGKVVGYYCFTFFLFSFFFFFFVFFILILILYDEREK